MNYELICMLIDYVCMGVYHLGVHHLGIFFWGRLLCALKMRNSKADVVCLLIWWFAGFGGWWDLSPPIGDFIAFEDLCGILLNFKYFMCISI